MRTRSAPERNSRAVLFRVIRAGGVYGISYFVAERVGTATLVKWVGVTAGILYDLRWELTLLLPK